MHKADVEDRFREYLYNKVNDYNHAEKGSLNAIARTKLFSHMHGMGDISPEELYTEELIPMYAYHSFCVAYIEGYTAAKTEILTKEEG